MGKKWGRTLGSQRLEGGIQVNVLGAGSLVSNPHRSAGPPVTCEGGRGRSAIITQQKSHRGSARSFDARFLLPFVCRPQAKREVETSDRSESAEPLRQSPTIQDGIPPIHLVSASPRKLRVQPRSPGRVFPHPNPQITQEVPKICGEGTGLSIQSPPLRPGVRPMDFYTSHVPGKIHGAPERNSALPLFRRLAGPGRQLPVGYTTSDIPPVTMSRTRPHCERGEVGTSPNTEVRFHRGNIRPNPQSGPAQGREPVHNVPKDKEISRISIQNCSGVAVYVGQPELAVQVRPLRPPLPQTTSVAPPTPLEPVQRISERLSTYLSRGHQVSRVVDSTAIPAGGSPPSPSICGHPYVHRCVREGLGGSCRQCHIPRPVGIGGVATPHKCPRAEGCAAGIDSAQPSSRVPHLSGYGQHHGEVVHKPAGRDKILVPHGGNSSTVPNSNGEAMDYQSQAHCRKAECAGRPAVQSGTGDPNRMDHRPTNSSDVICQVGNTTDRLVRHKSQQTMSAICVACPGPPSPRGGLPIDGFSGPGGLCVSPTPNPPENPAEIHDSISLPPDHSGPVVATKTLVPDTQPPRGGSPDSPSTHSVPTSAAQVVSLPPQCGDTQASRLAAGKVALVNQGHEEAVADRILAPQAKSSQRVYDAKWTQWVKWAQDHQVPHLHPTIPNIASFLQDLFNQGLAVSTIAGYRSVLASAFKFHTSLNITHSLELSSLIENFRHERPQPSNLVPKWDLDLVLWTLMDKPFEPIHDEKAVPLTFLTWKTTFLLLLASGLRRGELHAIPVKGISYPKDYTHMTFRPDPGFVAKTTLRTGQALQPFVIQSLEKLVGKEKERTLCPIRCTKAYLKRTEPLRGDRKLLLISPDSRVQKDISVNTISSWISSLLSYCYRQPGHTAVTLSGRSTHEIRAYASSLVHRGCWSLEDIMQSGSWTSNQVFVNHYLRDIAEQEGSLHRIGPLVAGKKIVKL